MKRFRQLTSFILTVLLIISAFPIAASATNESGEFYHAKGTANEPFEINNPSASYRIPSLASLSDDTLVAVADARWGAGMDGGGNDVVFSRSTDGGNTWQWQMLNYFPDNGDVFNKASTSFCDSEIATDGKNVWVISTFFPAGYAINPSSSNYTVKKEGAFDNKGRLTLWKTGEGSENYYLDISDKDENGNYKIKNKSSNVAVTDYSVTPEFYLYNNDTNRQDGSVFYSDSMYQARKTTYLWLRKSTDGGLTWQNPQLLNLKRNTEMFLGVGPGRGIVTSDGTLVFTTYIFDKYTWPRSSDDSQRAYLIWSKDGGKTWTRSDTYCQIGATNSSYFWTSESQVVELPDKTLRIFNRNGKGYICYTDAVKTANGGYDLGEASTVVTDVAIGSNCQISAVMYPYKIDGKDAIMVSCPSHPSGAGASGARSGGKIHVFKLGENNSMSNHTSYSIGADSDKYEYSCMTVLNNGDIALLYEGPNFHLNFTTLDPRDIAGTNNISLPNVKNVVLDIGETYNFATVNGAFDASSLSCDNGIIEIEKEEKSTVGVYTTEGTTFPDNSGTVQPLDNALFRAQKNGNETNWGAYWKLINDDLSMQIDPNCANSSSRRVPYYDYQDNILLYLGDPQEAGNGNVNANSNWMSIKRENNNTSYIKLDRQTGYAGTTSKGDSATRIWMFRKALEGEPADESIINPQGNELKIPGYIQITNHREITEGTKYVIFYKYDNRFYCMYPIAPIKDHTDYAWRAMGYYDGTANVVDKTNINFVGKNAGSTRFEYENTTYIITVRNVSSVTGAVKYSPVIYTKGDTIFDYGDNICTGETTDERYTSYTLASGWKIENISVLDLKNGEHANITATSPSANGRLQGTLAVNDNRTLASQKSIRLKTTLSHNGKQYTQVDMLWVAPAPIASHGVSYPVAYENYKSGRNVACPIVGVTMGSQSLGTGGSAVGGTNTDLLWTGNVNAVYNDNGEVLTMYDRDGMRFRPSHHTPTEDNISPPVSINGGKLAGYYGVSTNSATAFSTTGECFVTVNAPTGYYHYDKSSDENWGFADGTTSSNGKIEFLFNRGLTYNSSDLNTSDFFTNSSEIQIKQVYYELNGSRTTWINWNGQRTSDRFKAFDFTLENEGGYQKPYIDSINLSTAANTTANTSGFLFFEVVRYRSDIGKWTTTLMKLPFEINIMNKENVRKEYYKALTRGDITTANENVSITSSSLRPIIASDYTTSTWASYYEAFQEAQSYLGNELDTNDGNHGVALSSAYEALTKRADFSELDELLADREYITGDFPMDSQGKQIFTYDSWYNFKNAINTYLEFANVTYGDSELRAATPGFTVGPNSTTKLELQNTIDRYVEELRALSLPERVGDTEAYEAAKSVYEAIDYSAYQNEAEDAKEDIIVGDATIYDNETGYILISEKQQSIIDNCTIEILSDMYVVDMNNKGKKHYITICVDGVEVDKQEVAFGGLYEYSIAHLKQANKAIQATLTIYSDSSTDNSGNHSSDDSSTVTRIPTPESDAFTFNVYSDMILEISTVQNANITVYDYFNTTLYNANATEDDITIGYDEATGLIDGKLTICGNVITPKNYPALTFAGWKMIKSGGEIIIRQKGVKNGEECIISIAQTELPDSNFIYYGEMIIKSEEPVVSAVLATNETYTVRTANNGNVVAWKMRVMNGTEEREYLAGYGSSFKRFASANDIIYTPIIADSDGSVDSYALGDLAPSYGKVISYGDGFMSGNNKTSFTLSCFYSMPEDEKFTFLEAGAIYTTDTSVSNDELIKGSPNANIRTMKASKVSNYNTYTMTKSNATDGQTHIMRSYVSYSEKITSIVDGEEIETIVAKVTYGPVYQCHGNNITLRD